MKHKKIKDLIPNYDAERKITQEQDRSAPIFLPKKIQDEIESLRKENEIMKESIKQITDMSLSKIKSLESQLSEALKTIEQLNQGEK